MHDAAGRHSFRSSYYISKNVRVFTIADKYFIEPLKVYAASKFQPRATGEWKSPEFAQAIEKLYTAGPPKDRSLRNMVLSVVRDNVDELYGNKDQYAAFHKIISSIGDFAADVAESLATVNILPKNLRQSQAYQCPSCSTEFVVKLNAQKGQTSFDCLCHCYNKQTPEWWNKHKLEEK
ncbi:hypothetical protein LTR86_004732 [Recurvomyces mirabilis]|nr:hypothetical protein LTR86_004732 [Recurvomyces mirabilis]